MTEPDLKINMVSSKSLIGAPVKNEQGESLGEIDEIVLDAEKGNVSNVILATGGFLGKKRVAISWDMLRLGGKNEAHVIDMDKDFLNRVPAYQGDLHT